MLRKELQSEMRSKNGLLTSGLFGLVAVVTIAFATSTTSLNPDVASGLYWVAMLFASVLALPRTFLVEEEQGTGDLLRLLARPHSVYWGKALFNLGLIEIVGLALAGCYVIFTSLTVRDPALFVASVLGGCAALAGAVTLCGAIVARAAGRYALAAAVSMPMLLSILALGVGGMRSALGAGNTGWTVAFGTGCYAVAEFALGPLDIRGGLEKLKALKILFAVVMVFATVWSFHIPPALDFQQPNLARIFVWHLPCSIVGVFTQIAAAWFQLRYLRTRDRTWDERAQVCMELTFLWFMLTMLTGMLFSKVQWGAWWQWDPRQTSFLLVLMIYAAYLVMRGAFPDAERRAATCAGYGLAALLPSLFLIFVYPHIPGVNSFHPSTSIIEGKIKGEYAYSVTTMIVLMTVLTVWLYRLGSRLGLLELEMERNYE